MMTAAMKLKDTCGDLPNTGIEPESPALQADSFPAVRREGREPLPDHAGESPLLSRSGGERGLRVKSLLMKVKKENETVRLKLNIQKTKIMAPGPITSWQIDVETMETVTDFIFLGSKTTADGKCSHKIKRHLLLGRKAMTNLDSILKSRDITLLTDRKSVV